MTIPTISTLPTAPARTDAPATFISRADAFLAALVTMQSELNTSIGAMNTDIAQVNTDATTASNAATAAAASQAAAEAASNATLWVSGTSYSAGDVVYSPTTFFSYRANTSFTSTTDPASDAVNWVPLTASGGGATVELIATGSISGEGVTVALRSDGTVEQITSTGSPQSVGSEITTNLTDAADSWYACYDSSSNTVVVLGRTGTTIKVYAGLISGDTISFGSQASFTSSFGNVLGICSTVPYDDLSTTTVLIAYRDNNGYFAVKAVFISGTTVTFGSYELVVDTDYSTSASSLVAMPEDASFAAIHVISTLTNRLSVFRCTTSSNGNVITKGAENILENSYAQIAAQSRGYAHWNGSVLGIIWGNNNQLNTISTILTPSGTSFSLIGDQVVDASSYSTTNAIGYNPVEDRWFFAYLNSVLGGDNIKIKSGQLTGGSITFSAEVLVALDDLYYSGLIFQYNSIKQNMTLVNPRSISGNYSVAFREVDLIDNAPSVLSPLISSNITQTLFLQNIYQDGDNHWYFYESGDVLYYVIYTESSLVTNANDFIGFAQSSASDGDAVDIVTDYMVDQNQTGLTAKQGYYVDYDGSLSVSDTGYEYAGYALNSSTIQVKKQ